MSVTSWEAINDGRGGEESYQSDGTTITNRTRAWRVYTSANTDSDYTVMQDAAAPRIGASHPAHLRCRCISRSCRPESHSQKRQWIFTANYSTKWDIGENPLDDPARTEWSTETFQTAVWMTIDGKSILNSAGDQFDPPAEKDDSRWTSVTRKNVTTSVPNWIFAYQDAVNSDTFTIDGVAIEPGWAKVSAINLSDVQERNEIQYRVLTLTIHYRGEGEGVGSGSGSYGSGSGGDSVYGWDLQLLDCGFRELVDSSGTSKLTLILDDDKNAITVPANLDGEGHAIDDPTIANSVFLPFQVYRERAFSLISSYLT